MSLCVSAVRNSSPSTTWNSQKKNGFSSFALNNPCLCCLPVYNLLGVNCNNLTVLRFSLSFLTFFLNFLSIAFKKKIIIMHTNTDDLISSVCFRFLSFYFLSQFRFNIPQSTSHQLLLTRLANTVIFKIAASEVPLKWYRLAWEAVCLSWFLFSQQGKQWKELGNIWNICASVPSQNKFTVP